MKLPASPNFNNMTPSERDAYFRLYTNANPGGRYRPNLSAKRQLPPGNQGAIDSNPAPSVDIDLSGVGRVAGNFAKLRGANPYAVNVTNMMLSGASPEQMALSMGQSGLGSMINKGVNALSGGVPGVGPMVGAMASTAMGSNPNYKSAGVRSGINTLAALVGNAALPGLGGIIATSLADYITGPSWEHGFLGDVTDSRSQEKEKDAIEDSWGVGTSTTKDLAGWDALGVGQLGVNAAYGGTAAGKYESAAEKSGLFSGVAPASTPYGQFQSSISNSNLFGIESFSQYMDLVASYATQAAGVSPAPQKISNSPGHTGSQTTGASVREGFDLSTTEGAMGYNAERGLDITDKDTAMSTARGHAKMDTIGSITTPQTKEEIDQFGEFASGQNGKGSSTNTKSGPSNVGSGNYGGNGPSGAGGGAGGGAGVGSGSGGYGGGGEFGGGTW